MTRYEYAIEERGRPQYMNKKLSVPTINSISMSVFVRLALCFRGESRIFEKKNAGLVNVQFDIFHYICT